MIRLYSLCRMLLAAGSLYYLWFLAYYFITDKYFTGINPTAFFSFYWFLIVILFFYFKYTYIISVKKFLIAGGWSLINILSVNWLLEGGFHFYFYFVSLGLIPFSLWQVFRISKKMETNIRGIDENGEEFEMEEEEYLKMLDKLAEEHKKEDENRIEIER